MPKTKRAHALHVPVHIFGSTSPFDISGLRSLASDFRRFHPAQSGALLCFRQPSELVTRSLRSQTRMQRSSHQIPHLGCHVDSFLFFSITGLAVHPLHVGVYGYAKGGSPHHRGVPLVHRHDDEVCFRAGGGGCVCLRGGCRLDYGPLVHCLRAACEWRDLAHVRVYSYVPGPWKVWLGGEGRGRKGEGVGVWLW